MQQKTIPVENHTKRTQKFKIIFHLVIFLLGILTYNGETKYHSYPKKNCRLITKFLAQKARLARIQIAKATSGAAFVAKKRAAEARLAAQVNKQKKMSRPAQK